jgi:riboflavin kinase/FMN adenylyltransferase
VVLVEVHIPGFHDDLYGAQLDVAFMARLRGEMTFAGTEELVAQIDHDVAETLEIYTRFMPESSPLLG